MAKRKRRHFTEEQKADAVRMVREGRSVSEVARDLDLTDSALRNWVALDEARRESGGSEAPLTPAEREELKRLRRKVRELEQQRDFLKKATAFFAQETDRDTP
jgi:transposase